MWTGAVYLEGVATTGMPSPTPASLLMCVTLDIISVTSVTCHQAECWVMTLCPMLLRLFSLRDWPVVPAVAGDWALVAGPGALSSLSLSRPRHSAHITHTGDRASIETPEREVISEDIRPVLYFATHIST